MTTEREEVDEWPGEVVVVCRAVTNFITVLRLALMAPARADR